MSLLDDMKKADERDNYVNKLNSPIDINEIGVFETLYDYIFEESLSKDIIENRKMKEIKVFFIIDNNCQGMSYKLLEYIKTRDKSSTIGSTQSFSTYLYNYSYQRKNYGLVSPIGYFIADKNMHLSLSRIPFFGPASDDYLVRDSFDINIYGRGSGQKMRESTSGLFCMCDRIVSTGRECKAALHNYEIRNNEQLIQQSISYIKNKFEINGIKVDTIYTGNISSLFYFYEMHLFSKDYSNLFAPSDAKYILFDISW